ncbi:MAG: hypothetical protein R3E31_04390 [Chloroflexota bacterium]
MRQPGPPWQLVHVATINPVKDQATLHFPGNCPAANADTSWIGWVKIR